MTDEEVEDMLETDNLQIFTQDVCQGGREEGREGGGRGGAERWMKRQIGRLGWQMDKEAGGREGNH